MSEPHSEVSSFIKFGLVVFRRRQPPEAAGNRDDSLPFFLVCGRPQPSIAQRMRPVAREPPHHRRSVRGLRRPPRDGTHTVAEHCVRRPRFGFQVIRGGRPLPEPARLRKRTHAAPERADAVEIPVIKYSGSKVVSVLNSIYFCQQNIAFYLHIHIVRLYQTFVGNLVNFNANVMIQRRAPVGVCVVLYICRAKPEPPQ